MGAPLIYWQPSNIPSEIQQELDRRKVNRSFNFIGNQQASWTKDGNWSTYKGPMVSWIRACSNSAGHPKGNEKDSKGNLIYDKQRIVLHSGKGFYQTYGFQPPTTTGASKYQVIGYSPEPPYAEHIIENSLQRPSDEPTNYPIHVPAPEISRLEVVVQKELFRRATIEWVCFSWKQLVYLTPYFLVPGISVMLEWGWNHFNVQSLVNLEDRSLMQKLWDNAYPLYTNNILASKGNYDVVYGLITNFNWSIEGNKIICSTEITSKDRLYAGIAKDYALTVSPDLDAQSKPKANTGGIYKSVDAFLSDDDTAKTLRTIVTKPNIIGEELTVEESTPQTIKWLEILNPLLINGNLTVEQKTMTRAWVYGLFAGRPPEAYTKSGSFGTPRDGDFEKGMQDNDPSKIWINMGMIVAILNHFSSLPSGAQQGKAMFEVDIQNCIIGGYPNLISCDPNVLIPNYQAPKFQWGLIGQLNAGTPAIDSPSGGTNNLKLPYEAQVKTPINLTGASGSIANQRLSDLFFQGKNVCYRNDLDAIINYNRYRFVNTMPNGSNQTDSWSFPSKFTMTKPLPTSKNGLSGDLLTKDFSGLLSNVYLSYEAFKEAVKHSPSFVDIYNKIFEVLSNATDGFWDLTLVDADGTHTIMDRKFISKSALDGQGDRVYSFDYYDADSLIKSLKFRPVLSDAQATRVLFGEVNNKDSKFKYLDKNDVLDYVFPDAVIGRKDDKEIGDTKSDVVQRKSAAQEELRDLVRTVQQINKKDDGSLQMSINPNGNPKSKSLSVPDGEVVEVIKLVLPNQQLLRMLLNDGDETNNARYCAVQPGIILELTILGIGGLRTFQYFLVRNLPEPYSERNIIFRITDVHQTLEAGNWETTIRAQPLPLRGYIKQRLQGPYTETSTGWLPDSPQ